VTRGVSPSGHSQSWREVTLVCHHGQIGSGSASCTRELRVMSLTKYCSSIPQNWRPEKCSHLRLLLFRQALELSQLSRQVGTPGRDRTGTPKHGPLKTACLPNSTTGVWCPAPDSHRDAVRFELTRSADSHQLGEWRPRCDEASTGAPSRIRTRIVGLEGRLPVHRPGRIGAGERSRTVPCLVGNDAAHHARPRVGTSTTTRT
jgi:hypothetical protein